MGWSTLTAITPALQAVVSAAGVQAGAGITASLLCALPALVRSDCSPHLFSALMVVATEVQHAMHQQHPQLILQ